MVVAAVPGESEDDFFGITVDGFCSLDVGSDDALGVTGAVVDTACDDASPDVLISCGRVEDRTDSTALVTSGTDSVEVVTEGLSTPTIVSPLVITSKTLRNNIG